MKVSRTFTAAEDKAMAEVRQEVEAEMMAFLKRRKPDAVSLEEDPELLQLSELWLFLRCNYVEVEVERMAGVRMVNLKVSWDFLERWE